MDNPKHLSSSEQFFLDWMRAYANKLLQESRAIETIHEVAEKARDDIALMFGGLRARLFNPKLGKEAIDMAEHTVRFAMERETTAGKAYRFIIRQDRPSTHALIRAVAEKPEGASGFVEALLAESVAKRGR